MTNTIFSDPLSRFQFFDADCASLNNIVKLASQVPLYCES
jgi:hypothetical protein